MGRGAGGRGRGSLVACIIRLATKLTPQLQRLAALINPRLETRMMNFLQCERGGARIEGRLPLARRVEGNRLVGVACSCFNLPQAIPYTHRAPLIPILALFPNRFGIALSLLPFETRQPSSHLLRQLSGRSMHPPCVLLETIMETEVTFVVSEIATLRWCGPIVNDHDISANSILKGNDRNTFPCSGSGVCM